MPALAERSTRWSDLRTRVLSALVLVPLALACLWFGGAPFALLVILAGIGLAAEWSRMCDRGRHRWTVAVLPASIAIAAMLTAIGSAGAALGLLALTTLTIGAATRNAILALGAPYVGLATVSLLWLRADSAVGWANLLFLLLLIWASDIGAYLAGRLVGGPRLAPSISPGKTWSGAAGGLAAAVLTGLIASRLQQPEAALWRVACLAAGLGIIAQAGDLLESRIKRQFGVKDSGHLIPGHGGLLDRLDALLAVAPAAALLALSAGRGVVLWQ